VVFVRRRFTRRRPRLDIITSSSSSHAAERATGRFAFAWSPTVDADAVDISSNTLVPNIGRYVTRVTFPAFHRRVQWRRSGGQTDGRSKATSQLVVSRAKWVPFIAS